MSKQTLPHSRQLILIFMLQAVILSKLQSQLLMSNTLIFCPFLQLWEIILPPTPTLLDATVLCGSAERTDCYDAVFCLVMRHVGLSLLCYANHRCKKR